MKRIAAALILITLFSSLSVAQPSGTVIEGMKAVSTKYGVFFAYDSNLPVGQKSAVRSFSGKSLKSSLKALFAGTGIEWKVNGKYVLLTASAPPAPLEASAVIGSPDIQMDTIAPSVVTDRIGIERKAGKLSGDVSAIKGVVSPLGEGDPIKWAQSLPGVTTGADGTSTFYVRGGNSGNNLFSLDGVPVYGYSHILGLTTIVPQSVMQSASLEKGGIDGPDANFTAAHLRVKSRAPEEGSRTRLALNNFLVSAQSEGGTRKLTYLLSARVSPLSWEYRAVRHSLPSLIGDLNHFNAGVGDLYGKLHLRLGDRSWLDASGMGSLDNYSFTLSDGSKERMGWTNAIGILSYHTGNAVTSLDAMASINSYGSEQCQDKWYRYTMNHLSLRSSLLEYSVQAGLRHHPGDDRLTLGEGLKARFARFAPGQIHEDNKRTDTFLMTGWLQAEYNIPERMFLKAVIRGNIFHNDGVMFNPEFSISTKWYLSHNLALEATVDRMIQYYHTMEGLPVGWSLDMIVPTGEKVLPEVSWQGDAGLSGHYGAHSFSFGGFYKRMENLIYYKYSQTLFNGALTAWEDHTELGNGRAFGVETMYELVKDDWSIGVSYTLSKTLREDFPSLYGGEAFHARYDRRHVLNATAQWKGLSAALIIQSGHWENSEAETFPATLPGTEWTAKYFSGVNDFHMPALIRLDLGYRFTFETRDVKHTVSLGVCNATNHFNPSFIFYDSSTESWNELALLPILPNFSYQIEF